MSPLDDLTERARRLASGPVRAILGITGPPGAGKTTLAELLLEHLGSASDGLNPDEVAHLPMDGFHLADVQLDHLGLRQCKGAAETFDSAGYLATLKRVAGEQEETVYAPGFERDLEQPIAAAIAIAPTARLVVTEGNYLLLPQWPWSEIGSLLTEVWYVDLPDPLRTERLIQRHIRFGKSEERARTWVQQSDERNADQVRRTKQRADVVVRWDSWPRHLL